MATVLAAHFLAGASPEEFAQAILRNDRDAVTRACVPGVRLATDIGRYLKNPPVRSEQFREYNLFFYRADGAEMILAFNRENLLAAPPVIHAGILPELSREQMQADFDFLRRKMEETFPLDEVNRQVFDLDFRKVLDSYRAQIRDDMSLPEFSELVSNALNDCKGNHLWTADIHQLIENYSAVGEAVRALIAPTVETGAAGITHALTLLGNLGKTPGALTLRYFDGEYYNSFPFILENKEYPAGMKLLAVDGEATASLLKRLQPRLTAYDAGRNLFFGQSFTRVHHNIYLLRDGAEELTFEKVTVHLSRFRSDMQKYPADTPLAMKKKVLYLEEPQILYIRLPQMLINETAFYLDGIRKEGRDRKIRAVVLDVRGNSGGSDLVWMDILQALIGREYAYETKMALPDSNTIRDYLKHHNQVISKFFPEAAGETVGDPEKVTVPFLGNRTFLVSAASKRLVPKENSLRLDCPVYVIAHDIY